MAKNKDKKSTATDDEFAKPSEAPSSGGNKWPINKNNIGKLLLITPLREQTVPDKFDKDKTKKQIVGDVVILDEKNPAKSEEIEEAELEGGYILGSLRGYLAERRVLGRLQKDYDNKKLRSKSEPWFLEDAEPADIAVARAYLEALNDPFGGKGDDDEKPAKGKKSKDAEPEKKAKKKK